MLDTARFPGTEVPTVIANPVFLADRPAPEVVSPTFTPTGSLRPAADTAPVADGGTGSPPWGAVAGLGVLAALILAGAAALVVRRRRSG